MPARLRWIALALGLVAVLLGTVGRYRMRRVGVMTRGNRPMGRVADGSAPGRRSA